MYEKGAKIIGRSTDGWSFEDEIKEGTESLMILDQRLEKEMQVVQFHVYYDRVTEL